MIDGTLHWRGIYLPPYFKSKEDQESLVCRHCGTFKPTEPDKLQSLIWHAYEFRSKHDEPIRITSGYRCLQHPVEARKGENALHAHTKCALDLNVRNPLAMRALIDWFIPVASGIGFSLTGHVESRFIHVDLAHPFRTAWSY